MTILRALPGSDVAEQFELPDIDPQVWLTAGIYGLAALGSDLPLSKSLGLFIFVVLATKYHFGRRILVKGSIALAMLGMAIWIGLISHPTHWASDARDFYVTLNDHRLASN